MILLLTKFLINKEASSCFVFRIGQVGEGVVVCLFAWVFVGCLFVGVFLFDWFRVLEKGFHYVALDDLDLSGDQTGLNSQRFAFLCPLASGVLG